jgi:hypothetical protein
MARAFFSLGVGSLIGLLGAGGAFASLVSCASGAGSGDPVNTEPGATFPGARTTGVSLEPSQTVPSVTPAMSPSSPVVTTGPGTADPPASTAVAPSGGTTLPPHPTGPGSDTSGGPTPGHSPAHTNKDHCLEGYEPLPSDDTMAFGPAIFRPEGGGLPDTVVQPEVLQWMTDNEWQGAHVIWHAVRGCDSGAAAGLLAPLGLPNLCRDYEFLVPADQTCRTAGDGYQFLLFHRHMIETLKQLWPKHAEDFDGFEKFPTSKEELPEVWNENDPTWNAQILEAAAIGDDIEEHLDLFPDEGSLGIWLQCPVGQRAPAFAPQLPYIGLHFNLHDQWSRGANSTHGLNNGQVNITNYMFWKLHGWIDKVWEKYRVAKGITNDAAAMQKYRSDMVAQCREMDLEVEILKESMGEQPVFDCPPVVDETGEFHTKVRPILESEQNHCAACHGPAQTSPYAGLTLGGAISSKCIVERLQRASIAGGQFKLVEPGKPEQSWLYLKAAGLAEDAGCIDGPNDCNTAAMPPSGRTMTDAELEVLYAWIAAGAN